MEYNNHNNEAPIINLEPIEKTESKRWLTPKKMTALFVGSLSLSAVGVKAFGAQELDSELTGTPIEITVDSTPGDTTPDTTSPDSSTPDATTPGDTTPDTTSPDSSTPDATTPGDTTPDTTSPDSSTPDEPNYPEPAPQDIFGDICSPMGWSSCGEYNIYDSEGNIVNRVIADNNMTPEYINSISGGSDTGSAEKIRDINPVDTP